MMMPPQSLGSYSISRPAWQCTRCLVLNELVDMTCSKCGATQQGNSVPASITVTVGHPSSSMLSGSHLSSDHAFKIVVVIGIVLILSIIVVGLLRSAFIQSTPSSSPPDAQEGVMGGDTIYRGESFNVNNYLLSSNGRYRLVFQGDGNLVEYDLGNHNIPLWASNTVNKGATIAKMQPDGNFVIYGPRGYAPFATGTNISPHHTSGYRLVIQNDGNIVIYDEDGRVLWQAGY